MNIQEYISSGILESYVLGCLSPEEKREVEKYVESYPSIREEIKAIEKALYCYATDHSVAPPAYLKEKTFEKFAALSTDAPVLEDGKVRLLYKKRPASRTIPSLSIAATVLLLISTGVAIYFGVKCNSLDNSLNAIIKTNAILSDSLQSVASNLSQKDSDLAILKDPMYKIVELKGLKTAPEAKAMVCWCPMDKKVYVEIDKLPQAPKGMQYQLWAIVDGKPVSEGMLTSGNGLHPMKNVDKAQGFEVTLEKVGGSQSPEGETYAMGAINI